MLPVTECINKRYKELIENIPTLSQTILLRV